MQKTNDKQKQKQRSNIKHKQRDNYIDKQKFKSIKQPKEILQRRDKSWQPKIQKMIKHTYSKAEQRNDLIEKSQQQSNFLSFLNIDLKAFLEYQNKVTCKCNRSIKYYCTKCMTTNPELIFPQVQLDMNILILHHPQQKSSKSTGLPLQFLSPQITTKMFQEQLPEFGQGTYILYPHKDSIRVKELRQKPNRIVAIDSTWYQTGSILRVLQKQKHIKYIRLEEYETKFWRYQHHGEQALSTAQAVYYFMKQYCEDYQGMKPQDTTYLDNLLFLFALNKKIIANYYKQKINNKKLPCQKTSINRNEQAEKEEEEIKKCEQINEPT